MLPGYDIDKAAQATAFFALKAGGSINVLKLSKLLYLSEREAMERYDAPMFYDHLAALPDGPVVSITLNLINGEIESASWDRFVAPRSEYDIRVARKDLSFAELVDLSRADIAVLDSIWEKFRAFDRFALRDWTHDPNNIPEWSDPEGSSYLIPHESVFRHLGKVDPKSLVDDIEEFRRVKKQFARM